MTAPLLLVAGMHSAQQVIAAFALHAAWQVPLLVLATWVAVRVGRPRVGAAHLLWLVTLVLCVAAPAMSTWAGRSAAFSAEHATVTTISYGDGIDPSTLPELKRAPAWQRLLNQHLRHGVEPFALVLPQRAAALISCVWLAIALLCALRLLLALRHTWLLVHRASVQDVSLAVHDELHRQCDALGIAAPRAAVSNNLRGPALAGTLRPTLLLPMDVAAMTPAEVEAVLAHELAHLRRGDPLLHTLCALLLVPVGFHPAAWWAARRVRQTREIACDAEAAARMGSQMNYARALLQVADRIARGPAGVSRFGGLNLLGLGVELFDKSGALEERMAMVMQESAVERCSVRAARACVAAAVVLVAVVAASMFQVQPALASEQAPQGTAVTAMPEPQQPLLGGAHARQQLQQASHQLDEAAAKATTDEDRRKIATAQQVIRSAQHELAAVDVPVVPQVNVDVKHLSSPNINIDLQKLNVDLNNLHVVLQSMPDMKNLDLKALDPNAIDLRAARALANGNRIIVMHAKGDPRVQAQIEAARKAELESRAAAIKAAKEASAEQVRAAVEAARADAEAQRAAAIHAKAVMMARNEMPAPHAAVLAPAQAAQQDPDTPIKVKLAYGDLKPRGVMASTYTDEARAKHISGDVVVHVIINKEGNVEAAQVVSSPDESLSRSVLAAVKQMSYWPYLLNGRPQAIDTTLTTSFHNQTISETPQDADKPTKISGGVMQGNKIGGPVPPYPQDAKDQHISGVVVIHAIIDKTGHVAATQIVSSPSDSLSKSATDAVKNWTYRPYLLNGNPTDVDTTINVNYSFGG